MYKTNLKNNIEYCNILAHDDNNQIILISHIPTINTNYSPSNHPISTGPFLQIHAVTYVRVKSLATSNLPE